jgi:hypothetical protein
MRLRILILLALFAPSLAAAQNAETPAGVNVKMIEDLAITALPAENVLWEIEHSAQPDKAHEIFRDVTALDGGDVVFAGQIGDKNGKWEQSAFMALYDKLGALRGQNLNAVAGFQTIYDVHGYGDVLIAMGDYSEPQSEDDLWSMGSVDNDKVFIRIYDGQLQNMLHEFYLSDDAGSLYSPRMIEHDGGLFFKVLQRNVQMQESTILYALDVALNDGVYDMKTRKIGRYDGRSYDVAAHADTLYASGQAPAARLIRQPISNDAAEAELLAAPLQGANNKASNFSTLIADDDKIWVAGEWQEQNKRDGIFGHFDAAGEFHLLQHFSANDKALFSAKKLININKTTTAALYFIEPTAQDKTRYSVLMFLEKETGALCNAYRIGDAQSNNILAYNGAYHENILYIAGARAPKLSERLSGSMLQKARFMAYNAYGMAINLNDLKMCP